MKHLFKTLLLSLLLCLGLTLSSCGKKYDIKEYYGLYFYTNCVYVNKVASQFPSGVDKNYQNTAYDITENNFAIVISEDNIITINDVTYEQNSSDANLKVDLDILPEIISSKYTVRYDVFRNGSYQNYSIYVTKDGLYFAEARKVHPDDDYKVIWFLFKIQQRKGK